MISHKHKSIFVHVPKAAGSSIEQMFLTDLNWSKEISRVPFLLLINPSTENGPPRLSHLTAEEYVKYNYISQEAYESYFSFGWVRNPYGRIYSFYRYFCYNYFISFEKFVTIILKKNFNNKRTGYFYKPMTDFLYIEGSLAVDFVGKLETINKDIITVMKKSEIQKKELPHKNKSIQIKPKLKTRRIIDIFKMHPLILRHYTFSKKYKSKEYNPEMKKIMKELYFQDFENFGYEF